MPRFFVSREDISEDAIYIRGEDARHIARSLRMAVGDGLTVSDGEGVEYECALTKIRDELCELSVISSRTSDAESPLEITLFMAYPKSDKLEFIVQKAAELGCARVVPFESSRCIKRPKEDKAQARRERLNRIAREACGQSGRASLMTVGDCVAFSEAINMAKEYDIALFCYEGEGTAPLPTLIGADKSARRVCIIVGSEGGFSPEEARAAGEAGLSMTGLGKRILRCETAPLFVLSAISYAYEL